MSILHAGLGWAQYIDGDYSSGSPQAISGRTKLELNAVAGSIIETDLPKGYSTLWDSANDKFTPDAEGDAYDLRLSFTMDQTSGSFFNGFLDIELDIGGALGVIWEQSVVSVRSAQRHSVSIPIFVGSTFIVNGGTFYLEPGANTFDVYNAQLFVLAHYKRARKYS